MTPSLPPLRLLTAACLLALSPLATAQNASLEESLAMIEKLRHLRLDELGNPQIKSDAIPPVLSTPDRPHRMLIIPVAYANRGFDRFQSETDGDARNSAYLQELLFSDDLETPEPETLSHYYWHQSRGRFHVTGEVLPVVTVDQPSDYYGRPIQNSDGQWRNDSRAEQLVEDVLAAAYARDPDFPWEDFDVWDPQDYDGDGVYDEADGYIDHFVLVYAGNGQSSCQGLYNLDQKLTVDAPADHYDSLTAAEQDCAQRIWPHRFSLTANNGKGPIVEGWINRRGGVPLKEGLWVYDYNMQSEYTGIATFIHEFGHSIGLPDIYARQTSNSTASWDAMSSTAGPLPQELSIWSRLVLGWAEPCIIEPRLSGGRPLQSVYLKTMSDWSPDQLNPSGLCDSAMVILPPKIRELRMGPLSEAQGAQAAYTGQGNDLNHYLSRHFDFREVTAGDDLRLSFDAWFDIEADWDYLYVQASTDGETYERLLPIDKDGPSDSNSVMPSQRGHDGIGTLPGFTGRSGDLDGDGRVESAPGCDLNAERALAEERVQNRAVDPCAAPQWLRAEFDLGRFAGQEIELRFHYFADMAAVEDGALIDNVEIAAIGFRDDFESPSFEGWRVDGFSLSPGSHDIPVPQFYLAEFRDPYAQYESAHNYDENLAEPGFTFFKEPHSGEMKAVDFRYRPGVLLWYYNGSHLWSQNEPAETGPGEGFLLLVDSTPQEYELPGVPARYYKDDAGARYYDFDDDQAQPFLRDSFLSVMCFQRRPAYFPVDLGPADRAHCGAQAGQSPDASGGAQVEQNPDTSGEAQAGQNPDASGGTQGLAAAEGAVAVPGEALRWNERQLIYSYMLGNEVLPGEERLAYKSMSSLFDWRLGAEGISYRLYDRLLRNAHSADAPFSLQPFQNGQVTWAIENGGLVHEEGRPFPAVPVFSDAEPRRWLNPHLPFGSAAVPNAGLSMHLAEPGEQAPAGARVKLYFNWER